MISIFSKIERVLYGAKSTAERKARECFNSETMLSICSLRQHSAIHSVLYFLHLTEFFSIFIKALKYKFHVYI